MRGGLAACQALPAPGWYHWPNEIPQAANRVVGGVGRGMRAADRVVGAELFMARWSQLPVSANSAVGAGTLPGVVAFEVRHVQEKYRIEHRLVSEWRTCIVAHHSCGAAQC